MADWTFIHVSDIHLGSPRSFRFQPSWNENWATARRQILALKPDLLLVGGDVTRDGSFHRYELEAAKAELDTLPLPVHVVAGNMDTGNKHATTQGYYKEQDSCELNIRPEQLRNFEQVFGPAQWTFLYKGVRFSGFCDMLVNSGLPAEAALWEWLEAQTRLPKAEHHIWMTHYAVFIDDPAEPNFRISGSEDEYLSWYFGLDNPGRSRLLKIFKATGATHVLSGHVHCRHTQLSAGIEFNICPSTAFGQFGDHWPTGDAALGFMKYDVTPTGIKSSFIPLKQVSTKAGYGPGGHVAPEQRDYRLAWEK
ncbi:MAG: metallophosphoesterase [Lentisphaerae bacterium]|nr:metallophosphoesterase [Lentisphaerota bacterium]